MRKQFSSSVLRGSTSATLNPGNHRVTVPQQAAQDPRDLRFYKHFFARRCFHLGNGLPGLDKITDGVQVAENALCRRMEHPLGGIAANDTRNASVGGSPRPPE